MIRQAISCDICGAEKKQTNHWFVAWEQAGELRVSGWNSRNRLRTGSRHLCGQVCMHKLADDFMARVIAQKTKAPDAEETEAAEIPQAARAAAATSASAAVSRIAAAQSAELASMRYARSLNTDNSLTSQSDSAETSMRLLPAAPDVSRPDPRIAAALVNMRERTPDGLPLPPVEPPRFATRDRRAEAWQRERQRTQRASEPGPEILTRRASQV